MSHTRLLSPASSNMISNYSPLPLQTLLQVPQYFEEIDQLNFSLIRRNVKPVSRNLLKAALVDTSGASMKLLQTWHRPVKYGIQTGNIGLLSLIYEILDSTYPAGWNWELYCPNGIKPLRTLATSHNLEALKYLAEKHALIPNSKIQDLIHNEPYDEMLRQALLASKLDCAAFLLDHRPCLYPEGRLSSHPNHYDTSYASAEGLELMIRRGLVIDTEKLYAVCSSPPRDTGSRGYRMDPRTKHGCPIDFPHPAGLFHCGIETPLWVACSAAYLEAIEALLRLGANPNGPGSVFVLKNFGRFVSSSPTLQLLFSTEWRSCSIETVENLIKCFRMLFDYGASMSIAFSNGTAFDFFLLRLWQSVCQEMESTLVSMQRVEERLDAVTSRDSLYPWDHLCDVVTEATPAWKRKAPGFKGRERLIKFFRDHHSSNTGLSLIPPLKHVETPTWSDHLILAGKLTASENGSVWQVSGSLSHPNRG